MRPGEVLKGSDELAAHYKTSKAAVGKAVRGLADEGLIVITQDKRAVVIQAP
ncbi:MAG: hypothetical protein ACT4QF_04510 [Sporichthyaceae bacterium]